MLECDHCGRFKEDIFLAVDPYIEEIYGEDEENEETLWCDDCYQERLWDI
jgi:hypothetical protein